ncbi:hypothetical protein CMI47_18985 [Candidatus Pacearchaeota archaeon]|nr:hypothetical protein [Candidatus Pacearchaeota archaeon]
MKRPGSKKSIIIAAYMTDLQMAIRWAKLNKALISVGEIIDTGSSGTKKYAVTVKSRIPKSQLSSLIKDRFGIFINVI